jgi:hypothetical protein
MKRIKRILNALIVGGLILVALSPIVMATCLLLITGNPSCAYVFCLTPFTIHASAIMIYVIFKEEKYDKNNG